MKRAVNFRLSSQATHTLTILEKKMHTSKTAIVEKAIQFYARKALEPQNSLLQFAGALSNDEADSMLQVIESSKHNKDTEISF